MTGEIEIDIQFDADQPELLAEKTTDHIEAELVGTVPSAHPETSGQDAPSSPVTEIDMGVWQVDDGCEELPAATEVDMQLAPDAPKPSTEVGELTKMFYVELDELPATTGVDRQLDSDTPNPLAEKATDCNNAASAGPVPEAPPAPLQTIDMSVGNLADGFDEFEDIQLDTSEIDRDIDFARYLLSTAEIEPAVDDNVPSPSAERHTDTETGRMSDSDVREDRENI
jgi:hypothetical protein